MNLNLEVNSNRCEKSADSHSKQKPKWKPTNSFNENVKFIACLNINLHVGPHDAPPGWIWFNVSSLNPSMLGAELVLYRKTLHPRPISVTVTLHSVTASQGALKESPALEDRLLTLDQRPLSGYDVFDVSAVLALRPLEVVGFQLRYTDESGSLVLHEALTQSLYCLNRGSLSEPLLVLYQTKPVHT